MYTDRASDLAPTTLIANNLNSYWAGTCETPQKSADQRTEYFSLSKMRNASRFMAKEVGNPFTWNFLPRFDLKIDKKLIRIDVELPQNPKCIFLMSLLRIEWFYYCIITRSISKYVCCFQYRLVVQHQTGGRLGS